MSWPPAPVSVSVPIPVKDRTSFSVNVDVASTAWISTRPVDRNTVAALSGLLSVMLPVAMILNFTLLLAVTPKLAWMNPRSISEYA